MKSLIIGLLILAAATFAILPKDSVGFGLTWGQDVLTVLRGGAPIIAVLIGLIAVFIGIADIKDRSEAKKEKAEQDSEASKE
ncbi:MAG: hypothetical protein FWH41_03390 [Treponema sp.]|nr:hypothetical protein [Treponema sp.]